MSGASYETTMNEPFASMIRDPDGLIARQASRLAAAPELGCLVRRLTHRWSRHQKLAFCACLSLLDAMPSGPSPFVDASDWERETEYMTPRLLAQVPAILLLDLQHDPEARGDVDRAFSIFHRVTRLNAKPPTP